MKFSYAKVSRRMSQRVVSVYCAYVYVNILFSFKVHIGQTALCASNLT
jgi:hypothetical protein